MKKLIFLSLFFGFSTCLLAQTVTVLNTTNCDYVVRIFGSPTSPTTNCTSCYVEACIGAGLTVAVDLNAGSPGCPADTYVTMSRTRVQDPCDSPMCTSTNINSTSWTGCNGLPTFSVTTNSCSTSPCSNAQTTVTWTSSNFFRIDP